MLAVEATIIGLRLALEATPPDLASFVGDHPRITSATLAWKRSFLLVGARMLFARRFSRSFFQPLVAGVFDRTGFSEAGADQ
jgi:hypothetical protein